MSVLLEARHLGYRAGRSWLMREAELSLEAGQFTVILGPNGAGKSTLLRLLSGELAASEGEVTSLGQPLATVPVWQLAARRVVMAQAAQIAFPFTVADVVGMGCLAVGRQLSRGRRSELIEASLAAADLLPLAGRDFQTLSGGEQQRGHFARALCQLEAGRLVESRQVLMLDEPVASLDLEHQFALLDAARALARRPGAPLAVLAILHDLNLAASYADRLVVLNRGRLVMQGRVDEVITSTMLAEVFRVKIEVLQHRGQPAILPQERQMPAPAG